MSVSMEEKTEKSKGKRVTKNSTVPRGEDTDLERAVRKSEKEQRKLARRKAKEDKELVRALELSKQDAEREDNSNHMLELQSASSSSPPKLDVLGAISVGGHEVRICALTGIHESDPYIEEKALNSDDSSNRLMLQPSPKVPPFESADSRSLRSADGQDELDVSLEHDDVLNFSPSPTNSMNSLGKGMENVSDTPSTQRSENGEISHSPTERKGAVIKKESTYDKEYGVEHLLETTSEVESIHTERESSSDASEVGHSCVTQNLFEAINNTADTWEGEEDVLLAMKSLSLTKTTVVVNSKVFAGVVFKGRPQVCEVKELLLAQEKSFEIARQDLNKRLTQIRASETKKMQEPRKQLAKLISEYDEKLRILNLRLQASDALMGDSKSTTEQLESSLDDALQENRALKEKLQGLQSVLQDVFRHGNLPLKEEHANRVEPSSDPARQSSSVGTSRSLSSASTAVNSVKLESDKTNKKRDLSPASKKDDHDFKKPKCKSEAWWQWNKSGHQVATDYVTGPVRITLITKTKAELDRLMVTLQRAADDFRTLFSTDMPPEIGIKKRNEEKHPRFVALQLELMIPTIETGRKFALKFYYGKLLNAIRDILRVRERFRIIPNDSRKIESYIQFLGRNHVDVEAFRTAENNTKHIDQQTERLKEVFHGEFLKAHGPTRPYWLSEFLHRKVQNKVQLDRSAYDLLYEQVRVVYCDYHYFKYRHCIIEFYSQARTHFLQQSNNSRHSRGNYKTYDGGGPQARS